MNGSIIQERTSNGGSEIRRSIMHHYESQNDTELLQEEIDLIDNDPQLQVGTGGDG